MVWSQQQIKDCHKNSLIPHLVKGLDNSVSMDSLLWETYFHFWFSSEIAAESTYLNAQRPAFRHFEKANSTQKRLCCRLCRCVSFAQQVDVLVLPAENILVVNYVLVIWKLSTKIFKTNWKIMLLIWRRRMDFNQNPFLTVVFLNFQIIWCVSVCMHLVSLRKWVQK